MLGCSENGVYLLLDIRAQGLNLVFIQDCASLRTSALVSIQHTVFLPSIVNTSLEQARAGEAAGAHTFEGKLPCEIVAPTPDGVYLVEHQALIVHSDSGNGLPDHGRVLVVQHKLGKVHGDTRIDHSGPVDVVGPCQRCNETRECLLVPTLRITELGVRLQAAALIGHVVVPGELRGAGVDQSRLGASHWRCAPLQIHRRSRRAEDERQASMHRLLEHK